MVGAFVGGGRLPGTNAPPALRSPAARLASAAGGGSGEAGSVEAPARSPRHLAAAAMALSLLLLGVASGGASPALAEEEEVGPAIVQATEGIIGGPEKTKKVKRVPKKEQQKQEAKKEEAKKEEGKKEAKKEEVPAKKEVASPDPSIPAPFGLSVPLPKAPPLPALSNSTIDEIAKSKSSFVAPKPGPRGFDIWTLWPSAATPPNSTIVNGKIIYKPPG